MIRNRKTQRARVENGSIHRDWMLLHQAALMYPATPGTPSAAQSPARDTGRTAGMLHWKSLASARVAAQRAHPPVAPRCALSSGPNAFNAQFNRFFNQPIHFAAASDCLRERYPVWKLGGASRLRIVSGDFDLNLFFIHCAHGCAERAARAVEQRKGIAHFQTQYAHVLRSRIRQCNPCADG